MLKAIAKLIGWYQHPVIEMVMLTFTGSCLLMLLGLATVAFLAVGDSDIFNFTPYLQR